MTDAPDDPGWLDAQEQDAWRQLMHVLLQLPGVLEARLQRGAGLSHMEYYVMSFLSEAPQRTLQMSAIAEVADVSLSRLSHLAQRLEKRGWLQRRPLPEDGRITVATLTGAGYAVLVEAAPGHVADVRALVFDGLDPEQVRQLATIGRNISERLTRARENSPR